MGKIVKKNKKLEHTLKKTTQGREGMQSMAAGILSHDSSGDM